MSAAPEITFDFAAVERGAERVRRMLLELRRRHDLSRFEYTRQVRIAPTEIPHSHPVLTLNTWVSDDLGLMSMYLHEQMHWYLTWFSHRHVAQWRDLFRELRGRYPDVPVGGSDVGNDQFSTYLHLIVNYLEIDVVGEFVGHEYSSQHARGLPFYRWIYSRVIEDWKPLGALYRELQVLPIRPATDMSVDDLGLAALTEEATITPQSSPAA